MTALQVYSNAVHYSNIFLFIASFIIISIISVEVYLYIKDYTENINNTINNLNKKLISQLEIIKQLSNKCDAQSDTIKELSNMCYEFQKKIEVIKKDLNDISEHSHKNMDKIFELKDTINSKYSELTSKISCNDKDMGYIDIRVSRVETMIPNYLLIGFKKIQDINIPIFVPNTFTFTEDNIINYGMNHIDFIVDNFKFIQNLKEIVLANIQNFTINFTKKLFSTYNGNNLDEYNENRIISICEQQMNNVVGWPSRPNPNYILNIQAIDTRNYYKKGLRTLRSELLKMNIKLILNEDLEEFIR